MNYLQLPIAILPHLRRLSGVQAAIWADAWTWGQQEAQAFRTNEQYAQMFGSTVKSISRSIATMREMGMLESRMVNGRQRILVACIPTNVHPHERPSTGTSIHMNVHAASTPTSMQHPHERPCSIPTNVHQVYHVVEQEVNHSVEKEPKPKKAKRERVFHDVVLPYDTDTFKAAWKEWLDYKWHQHRFAYKRDQDEQTALHHLQTNSNGNEQLAIHIIAASIASGYQGLFASAAKSFMGPGSRTGRHLRPSGEYANPSDVLKDRNIWG
jgi:hypothetical protein